MKKNYIDSRKFEGVTLDTAVDSAELNAETEALYVDHCDSLITNLLDAAMEEWIAKNPEPPDGLGDDHRVYEDWCIDCNDAARTHWEKLDWDDVPTFEQYMA